MAIEFYVLAGEVIIDSTNKVIRIEEDNGAQAFDVTLTEGSYWLFGDGSEATDLMKMMQDAFGSASSSSGAGNEYFFDYVADVEPGGVTGTVTLAQSGGTNFQIFGAHANTTFDLTLIGFPQSTSSLSDTLTSPLSPKATWCGTSAQKRIVPGPFEEERFVRVSPGGQVHTFLASDVRKRRRIEFEFESEDRTYEAFSASDTARTYESFHGFVRDGRRIRLYEEDVASGYELGVLDSADLVDTYVLESDFPPMDRDEDPAALYGWSIDLRKYVA